MLTRITKFFLELAGWSAILTTAQHLPELRTMSLHEVGFVVVLAMGMMWVSRMVGWRVSVAEL